MIQFWIWESMHDLQERHKKIVCLLGQQATSTSKWGLHPKRFMLSIWWDIKGLIHFEFFKENNTNSKRYFEQLDKFDWKIKKTCSTFENRKSVILQQDNPRPGNPEWNKLGWKDMSNTPYSSGSALSDFHYFCHWKII